MLIWIDFNVESIWIFILLLRLLVFRRYSRALVNVIQHVIWLRELMLNCWRSPWFLITFGSSETNSSAPSSLLFSFNCDMLQVKRATIDIDTIWRFIFFHIFYILFSLTWFLTHRRNTVISKCVIEKWKWLLCSGWEGLGCYIIGWFFRAFPFTRLGFSLRSCYVKGCRWGKRPLFFISPTEFFVFPSLSQFSVRCECETCNFAVRMQSIFLLSSNC